MSGVKHDGKARKIGGGPKYAEENYPGIEDEIRKLIDGSTYGNPERVLSYTTKSLRKIEAELKAKEINASHETIKYSAQWDTASKPAKK